MRDALSTHDKLLIGAVGLGLLEIAFQIFCVVLS
jgi:hypothetical protein